MFTELCIIKKSYDEKFLNELKRIGYNIDDYVGDEKSCDYIMNIPRCKAISFGWSETGYSDIVRNGAIQCENENQFLAIAALRDDTDIYQWFTDDIKWVISDVHNLLKLKEYFIKIGFDYLKTRKSTVPEILEHFKSK